VVVTPDRVSTAPFSAIADTIEIELASEHCFRSESGVTAASLRLVLDALERR
jgi:hypothetical protein